jgi:hypothetical protein
MDPAIKSQGAAVRWGSPSYGRKSVGKYLRPIGRGAGQVKWTALNRQ